MAPVLALTMACQADAPEPPREIAVVRDSVIAGSADSIPFDPSPDATVETSLTNETMTPFLDRYDFSSRAARFDLPGRLDEISGLAFTPDGRMLAHDDERGRVYQIDPVTGDVGKSFDLGSDLVRDDFEGIAVADTRIFLVTSAGLLYEVMEGGDGSAQPYRVTDTGIGSRCEVEGLEFDPTDEALLVSCKVVARDRGTIVVFRLPLDPSRAPLDPLLIPRDGLRALGIDVDFEPSAIAVDPAGTILILSGRHEALIEVSREGRIVAGVPLSGDRHPQAEGLAIGPDGTIYISDEKNGNDARLTVYAPTPAGSS